MDDIYQLIKRFWRRRPNVPFGTGGFFDIEEQSSGFTIVEIVMVTFIIGVMSLTMITNFRQAASNNTARNQTVAAIVADIRRAQSLAINSTLYQGQVVCGYGVHYVSNVNNNQYLIYARLKPVNVSCAASGNRNFTQGAAGFTDVMVQNIFLANPKFEIKATCSQGSKLNFTQGDIFFEPPDPKTYINNDAALNAKSIDIYVRIKSTSNCNATPNSIITVNSSNSVDVVNND